MMGSSRTSSKEGSLIRLTNNKTENGTAIIVKKTVDKLSPRMNLELDRERGTTLLLNSTRHEITEAEDNDGSQVFTP